jgi:hypothetical protein
MRHQHYNGCMALATLELQMCRVSALPEHARAFLDEAAARTDRFMDAHKDEPAAGFVPSDYELVYAALKSLHDTPGMLPGKVFCEWGSGLGVIASLGAMIGFDSIGIEIDARLVKASQQLARDHGVNRVQFLQGSYVPDGHHCEEDFDESHVMTLEQGKAAYGELGLDPDDFDCVFAYPWPGEDEVISAVFDRYAARGAVLLTYHGQDGVLARRKVK